MRSSSLAAFFSFALTTAGGNLDFTGSAGATFVLTDFYSGFYSGVADLLLVCFLGDGLGS